MMKIGQVLLVMEEPEITLNFQIAGAHTGE